MPIPANIDDLLNKRKIESNRIEFKKGWNPDSIYRTIAAFANDFDNIGGGYILVGVEEENGIAKRPVTGIPPEELDAIQKEMVGYNNKIDAPYLPRTEIVEVDGKNILAIWIPTGRNRPYKVKESVVSKKSESKYYVRSGSSTIEAKGETLEELLELSRRIPFDDRGNPEITLEDISAVRVRDYLVKAKSRLKDTFKVDDMMGLLESLDLLTGPPEHRLIKNVAAMMFSENPQKFFPVTRVEIVIFPEGSLKNPNNMIEAPVIEGPVPAMIDSAMAYLKAVVIREQIIKQKFDLRSLRFFNFPYQALEEAVTNALYHRDYQEREPVEITVEPDKITILSFTGPDRSVSVDAIKKGERLYSRRYRNRKLGDFLKELEYTEGRSTGIPTIQNELEKNGSPKAIFETNEDRSYFMITIPVHPDFKHNVETAYIPKVESKTSKLPQKNNRKSNDLQTKIIKLVRRNNQITQQEIASILNISRSTVSREIKKITYLHHMGPAKGGYWMISSQS